MQSGSETRAALYASAGSDLIHFDVDLAGTALTRRDAFRLPASVQYAWQSPSRRFLYIAASNGGPGSAGDAHWLCALRIAPNGSLHLHGAPLALRWRPIHITLDMPGEHAIVAYNKPSGVSVHRIARDGTVGAEVAQAPSLDAGTYAHQVRVAPSNRVAILVARGNDAAGGRPEDPGALKLLDYRDGRLINAVTIAPADGYGFGPRHVDFHPSRPWLYVSLERQNLLHVWRFEHDVMGAVPAFEHDLLAAPRAPGARQVAGTLHAHPNGRFVYVANRSYGTAERDGETVWTGGENNIAVFAIDVATGAPTVIQHADTGGVGPRCFALDPAGRLLVAANFMPIKVREAGRTQDVPATLAVFRVGDDGRLAMERRYEVDVGRETMFWMGIVPLPDA